MTMFDKWCAGAAFVFGIAFVVLGVLGVFFGCNAHFTLPPVLGVIPALVGWGIVRTVRLAWRQGASSDRQRWKSSHAVGERTHQKSPPGGAE